ncbi:DUF4258 domain-containing protein [Candidatus Woesearchaeota archaeon]|nr:DUF4258 domain-containing protein [Candidatus Woesearchaeota archaeon]
MKIIYSDHAIRRLKQRGISILEIEYGLENPKKVRYLDDDKKQITTVINNRELIIIFVQKEKHIKIITVL